MSRKIAWIMIACLGLSMASGCADHRLNDDWLELNKTQHAITDKLLEFEETHMNLMKGLLKKHFSLLEQEITFRESEQFLRPRTVLVDGVARIMAEGPDGQPVAVSRDDLEKFVTEAMKARAILAQKKAEWNHVFADWEKTLEDVRASNELNLKTAKDLHAALESAQRVLEDISKVVGAMAATTATFFLTG